MNQVSGGSRHAQGGKVILVRQNSLCWILKEENIPVNRWKYSKNVASQSYYEMQEVLPEEQSKSSIVKFAKTFQIFDLVLRREMISNQPSKLSDLPTFANTGKDLCWSAKVLTQRCSEKGERCSEKLSIVRGKTPLLESLF